MILKRFFVGLLARFFFLHVGCCLVVAVCLVWRGWRLGRRKHVFALLLSELWRAAEARVLWRARENRLSAAGSSHVLWVSKLQPTSASPTSASFLPSWSSSSSSSSARRRSSSVLPSGSPSPSSPSSPTSPSPRRPSHASVLEEHPHHVRNLSSPHTVVMHVFSLALRNSPQLALVRIL